MNMTTKNLLVELLVEELPPKALKKMGEAFATEIFQTLRKLGYLELDSEKTIFATPRRLGVHITSVLEWSRSVPVRTRLLPVAIAFDANGNLSEALLKKLEKLEAAPKETTRAFENGKEFLFLERIAAGRELSDGLGAALHVAIENLPIPKVMSYQLAQNCEMPGWSSVSFVRPAHKLIALHGTNTTAITVLGLKSGRETLGHRFEATVSPVVIKDADSYAATLLKDGAVIPSFAERRAEIERQLAAAAAQAGAADGTTYTPIDDAALLDEVTGLVERPNVLTCAFEKEFLDVPQECLILTMKANQKYFPLLDTDGKLSNKFLVVSNISPVDTSAVIGGNERVVRPRLADAKFFFDQDRKKTLESRVSGLDKVVYHNKLGSQGERILRVRAIAKAIGQQLGGDALAAQADQAANLAKSDLVTDMVGEFPELQGTMGRYYALNDGLSADVADAIEDHYKPRFAGDTLPRNQVGVVVALADKLETLVGMFGIGNLPTGDKDPFALRRHALGVARMLVESQLSLQFHELTRLAFAAFSQGMLQERAQELDEFLIERLKGYLKDTGYSSAEVDAAIFAQKLGAWFTLPKRLAAVRTFNALPEAPALAAANKRITNILKKAQEAAIVDPHVSEILLKEPAEIALFAAMNAVAPKAKAQFDAGDYTASLQTLAALRAPVDAFFDGVMVNAEELDLRLNRQGLLKSLHEAMNRVADLSKLAT